MSFEGKVALVTGGASGIGRATAVMFAEKGAKVIVSDVDEDGGAETVRLIADAGGEAAFIACDVADEEQVKALISDTVSTYGGLHCAHNNAGIEGEPAPMHLSSTANLDRVIDINLKGVYWCMKYEILHMMEHGGGAIVNTSSVAGLVGSPNVPAYAASKHAVWGLTKTAALEYAQAGIRVNSVHPGVIDTPMIARFTGGDADARAQMAAMQPMGRMGTADEIAAGVVWLCSDESSFITGHHLTLDGGIMAQ